MNPLQIGFGSFQPIEKKTKIIVPNNILSIEIK